MNILQVFSFTLQKMSRKRRVGLDPSYFCADENDCEDCTKKVEHTVEEEFYEKGSQDSEPYMNNHDVLVIPGGKGESNIHVDIASARKIVRELHENWAHSAITSLSDEAKKQFLTLHEVIEALKDTDARKFIRDMIVEEFKCEENPHFKLGTVGAYFCECKGENNFPGNKSCSLSCLLGSVGMKCQNDYPCEYTCISYNGDGSYSTLYQVDSVKQAYLFVNDKFKFEGIQPGEFKYFAKLGVDEVKIVKHSEGLSYQEITSDFIPIRNLIVNGTFSLEDNEAVIDDSNVTVAVIVVLILILLFAGAGGWYYYGKSPN